ncbi:MAG: hypothetical protein HGB21_04820 [Nitrospirae bacterium]|nr:hypothetical protein [Nitrospirota bacterium]
MHPLIMLLPAVCLALSGCAATKVTQVWRDESYRPVKLKNVLVVALAEVPTVQREIESRFAKQFRDRGITVTEGFRIISNDQRNAPDSREVVAAKVRELGVDAVLIIERDSGRTEKEYIPGMTIVHGTGYGMGGGGTAVVASSQPMAPTTQGYEHTNKFFGMQTQLYDAGTGKIIWFVRTETRMSGPLQEEIKPYVADVSARLFGERFF